MKSWKQLFATCVAIMSLCLMTQAHAATDNGVSAPASVVDRSMNGDKVCTSCHDENDNKTILAFYQGKHGVKADGRTPGCQSCHGPSLDHVKNGSKPGASKRSAPDIVFGGKSQISAQDQNKICISCHEGGLRTHWAGSVHESRDVTCVSCHSNHVKQDNVLSKATQAEVCYTCHKTQRSQVHRMSAHPLDAGKMACSDCHNPHGSTDSKLMVKGSVNETCLTCHAEKRGPFLWEHSPVAEDCLTCHTPHGSSNTPLLKQRLPWLCEQCHVNTGAGGHYGYFDGNYKAGGTLSGTSPTSRLAYRGCVNCHSQIHGSNSPAGSRFVR